MTTHMVQSPPNSGVVLWTGYHPNPIAPSGKHSFLVESAMNSTVHQDVTSSVVKVVAGRSAGLRLVNDKGSHVCRVNRGKLRVLGPGQRTAMTDTDLSKQVSTLSSAEDVETRISFQAVATPGRRLPPGGGAIIHKYAISVTIA
jgi:hypothetical protein